MYAAVVELDTLPDAIRATTEHHDLLFVARMRLALFLVGRIHIGRTRGKLSRAGVNPLIDRSDSQKMAPSADISFADFKQLC